MVFIGIGIGVAVLVGALFGWQYSILGLGAALGPQIGVCFGKKKDREVEQYREELIQGRRRQARSDGSAR